MSMTKANSYFLQIPLRSNNKHHFTNKNVRVYKPLGFVSYSCMASAVCNTNDATITYGYWNKVIPKMTATKYMIKNGDLLVSSEAIKIILSEYQASAKDTWGVFADDGLNQLLSDLGALKQKRKYVDMTQEDEEPQKKPRLPIKYDALLDAREVNVRKNEKTLIARHELLDNREGVLKTREAVIQAREGVVADREKTLNEREQFLLEKEKDITNRVEQYTDLSKKLERRTQRLQQFFDQTLALVKKYTSGNR